MIIELINISSSHLVLSLKRRSWYDRHDNRTDHHIKLSFGTYCPNEDAGVTDPTNGIGPNNPVLLSLSLVPVSEDAGVASLDHGSRNPAKQQHVTSMQS
jgi:hypothetical protein